MAPMGLLVALVISEFCGGDARAYQATAPGRTLQEAAVTSSAKVRVADFSTLVAGNDTTVDEMELPGYISITSSDEPVMYGAYYLGPSEVAQLNHTLATKLRIIPASEARDTPIIEFPGRQLLGRSVVDSLSDRQEKRIPTIFAPFYSGYKFTLLGKESPPGTTLHLSNMTLLVANATYDSLSSSGIVEYFQFGASARTCITNSMFVLQSCKGFEPNSLHMWCCTKRQCNIHYTEQAMQDLGYDLSSRLEFLTCHELQPSTMDESLQPSIRPNDTPLVVPLVGSGLAVCTVLIIAVLVLWRRRRAQGANHMKADEMQMQMGKYMQA